ncbi:DNA methyltransferase, partial [Xanthomonas vasicola]
EQCQRLRAEGVQVEQGPSAAQRLDAAVWGPS